MRIWQSIPRPSLLKQSATKVLAWLCICGLVLSGISACGVIPDAVTVPITTPATIITHDFTPVSKLHTSPGYLNLVKQTLIDLEGVKTDLYHDTANIPTIGIGYNLKVPAVVNIVLSAIGLDPATLNDKEQQALSIHTVKITKALSNFKPKTGNFNTLSSNLNQFITEVHDDTALPAAFRNNVSPDFSFKSEDDAINIFDTVYKNLDFEKNLSAGLDSSDFNDSA